jgi:radical SAM protein with 4Fe4S-binding SPASM domain
MNVIISNSAVIQIQTNISTLTARRNSTARLLYPSGLLYAMKDDRVPKTERDIAEVYFNRRVSAPFRVICEVTYRCNARCIHCYAPAPQPYRVTELTPEEWKKVIQDISDVGAFRIVFTGGEPLLREDLFDMIELSHNLGMLTFLETNGSLIDKKNAEKLVDAGLQYVNISINRSTAKAYDVFSGYKGLFEKATNALKMLSESPVETAVFTTVNKVNIKEIPEIIDVAADVKADRIAFVHISPAGRARTNQDLYPTPQEYMDVLKRIYEKDLQYPDLVVKYPNLPALYFKESVGLDVYEKVRTVEGFIELCTAGITSYVIDPAGNIKPCTVTERNIIGNVKKDSLKDVWLSSSLLENLRDLEKYYEVPCSDCDLNRMCVAGHRCLDSQLDYLRTHENSLAAPLCDQCYSYMRAQKS